MPTSLEFEDKVVEKAIKKACAELDIPKEKLKYDVISYGSTGIFGLVGVKKARIRVIIPDHLKSSENHSRSSEKFGKNKGSDKGNDKKKQTSSPPETFETESTPVSFETEQAPLQEELPEPDKIQKISRESLETGTDALQRIIDFITTDAQISVEVNSERVLFNVKGGNSGVLIGKRGQTLEAIQYLVEKIVNKQSEKRVRVQIDVEGYLVTRRNRLRSLAAKLSQKAKRTGKPVSIGQLNAHDRRIVHISLKDDNDVRTQSMGDGFYRKLVIFPKKSFRRR